MSKLDDLFADHPNDVFTMRELIDSLHQNKHVVRSRLRVLLKRGEVKRYKRGHYQSALSSWDPWEWHFAKSFLKELRETLSAKFNIAVTGGLLFKNGPRKDLDIIIYPQTEWDVSELEEVRDAMRSLGCELEVSHQMMLAHWKRTRSVFTAHRMVEVWSRFGHRIDVIYMNGKSK
jgi:hypothetical protein